MSIAWRAAVFAGRRTNPAAAKSSSLEPVAELVEHEDTVAVIAIHWSRITCLTVAVDEPGAIAQRLERFAELELGHPDGEVEALLTLDGHWLER